MKNEIIQAEQQLLGYVRGILGFSIGELLDSMNLSREEWGKIKYDYEWIHNYPRLINDIENYFLNKKKINHKNFIAIRDYILDVIRDEDELDYKLDEKITSNIGDLLNKKINF